MSRLPLAGSLLRCLALTCLLPACRLSAEVLPTLVPDASLSQAPYSSVGLVRTDFDGPDSAVWGSGAAVGTHVVLTAAHVFYEPEIKGWNRCSWYWQSVCTPSKVLSYTTEIRPRSARVLAGYSTAAAANINSVDAFNKDTLTLMFYQAASQGTPLGTTLLSLNQAGSKMGIGYPGELHGKPTTFGAMYAHAPSSAAFTSYQDSPVLSLSTDLIAGGGASGGPLMVQTPDGWSIGGVVVAKLLSNDTLIARQIDAAATDLITQSVADTAPGKPGSVYWTSLGFPVLALQDGGFLYRKDSKLQRLKEDGAVVWETEVGSYSIYSQVSDGSLLAASASSVTLLDLATGQPLQNLLTTTLETPAVGEDGTIYLCSSDGLQAWLDGSRVWTVNPVPAAERTANDSYGRGPVLGLDGSIVAVFNGRLYSIKHDGSTAWRSLPLPDSVAYSLSVAPNGDLLVATGATVSAFRQTGEPHWTAGLDGANHVSVAAIGSDGTIYLEDHDNFTATGILRLSPDGRQLDQAAGGFERLTALTRDGGWITHTLEGLQICRGPDGTELWRLSQLSDYSYSLGSQSPVLLCASKNAYPLSSYAIITQSALDPGAWIGSTGPQSRTRRSPFSQPVAPTIGKGPEDKSVVLSTALTLSVQAHGTAPLRYEWYKDGVLLPIQVGSRLVIASAAESDAGSYTVRILNAAGSVTSTAAKVSVIKSQPGLTLWTTQRIPRSPASVAPDGTVYAIVRGNNAGIDDNKALIASFSAGGLEQWANQLDANDSNPGSSTYNAPLVADDGSVWLSTPSYLYGFDKTGKLLLKQSTTSGTAILSLGRNKDLYVTVGSDLLCIDLTNSKVSWQKTFGPGGYPNLQMTKEGMLLLYLQNLGDLTLSQLKPDGSTVWTQKTSERPIALVQADGSLLSSGYLMVPAWADDPNAPLTPVRAISVTGADGLLRYRFRGEINLQGSATLSAHGDLITESGHLFSVDGTKDFWFLGTHTAASLIGTMEDDSSLFLMYTPDGGSLSYYGHDGVLRHQIAAPSSNNWTVFTDGRLLGGMTLSAIQGYSIPCSSAWPLPLADPQATRRPALNPKLTPLASLNRPNIKLTQTCYRGYDLKLSFTPAGSEILGMQWQFNGVDIAGATGSELVIHNASNANVGNYTLVVRSPAGNSISDPLQVTVQDPLVIAPGWYAGTVSYGTDNYPFAALVDTKGNCTYYPASNFDGNIVSAPIGPDGTVNTSLPSGDGSTYTHVLKFTPALTNVDNSKGANLNLRTIQPMPGLAVAPGLYRGRSQSLPFPNFNVLVAPDGGVYFSFYELKSSDINALYGIRFNGQLNAGSTAIDYTSSDGSNKVHLQFTGDQRCQVSLSQNNGQEVTRQLTAIMPDRPSQEQLSNLSTRGLVGQSTLTCGFVINGSKPQPMLIRAVGPMLKAFGLDSAAARTRLDLYDSAGKGIASNAGWSKAGNSTDISANGSRLGAFGLTDSSLDSALWVTLTPGLYTAEVSGDGSSGLSLVEAYDGQQASSRANWLSNLSTRGRAAPGVNALIAGLVIDGKAPKTLLIRGVGPSLNAFLPANTVCQDTRLSIADSSSKTIASNEDWTTNEQNRLAVKAAGDKVGAFGLSMDKDAAMVITLAPGSYTILVSCDAGMEGTALVEVYEIPADF